MGFCQVNEVGAVKIDFPGTDTLDVYLGETVWMTAGYFMNVVMTNLVFLVDELKWKHERMCLSELMLDQPRLDSSEWQPTRELWLCWQHNQDIFCIETHSDKYKMKEGIWVKIFSHIFHGKLLNLGDELCLTGTWSSVGKIASAAGEEELSLQLEQCLHHAGLPAHQWSNSCGVTKIQRQVGGDDLIVRQQHRRLRLK